MRSVLLVVLPHLVGTPQTDASKKKVRAYLAFPYGVLTLASYIKRYATNLKHAEILDLNLPNDKSPEEIFTEKLLTVQPDIVGFSLSYDVSYPWLKKLLAIADTQGKRIYTVAGGPATTTAYTEILNECTVDACCYSEGEMALKNLIDCEDLAVGIQQDPWVTREKLARKHITKPLYDDLDKIVDVDYSLVDVPAYSMKEAFSPFTKFNANSKQFFIVTSRGCPFKCVFCAEPSFHGANMRYVTVDVAVDHIARLQEKYGLNVLTIYDDQILMNKPRAKEFFAKLAPLKIRVEMPNGVTLSYIDEEMAQLMKNAGVDTIFLAIEHGSKRVLKEIIRKPISFSRIKPVIQALQQTGIYCQGFFVIGLPGETRAERQETRDIIIDWGLDWASFNYATPLRGSELYRMCREKGWIEEKYLPIGAIDMTRYVIRAPGMDQAEIEDYVFNTNLDVNFVNNRNLRVGNLDLAKWTFEEVTNRFAGQAFGHYFTAEVMKRMGKDNTRHIEAYKQIIDTSDVWRKAAQRFGLNIDQRQLASVA